jgi:hypothetical protein
LGECSDLVGSESRIEYAKTNQNGSRSKEAGGHDPIPEGLNSEDILFSLHDGLDPFATQTVCQANGSAHRASPNLIEEMNMVKHQYQKC